MRKTLLGIAWIIGFGLVLLLLLHERSIAPTSAATTTYTNDALGFAFEYPGSSYVLEEHPKNTDTNLLLSISLVRKEDKEKAVPVGGEFPPTINVYVLKNQKMQHASVWAKEHKEYSTINLLTGEISEQSVGGAQTIRYTADGLYMSDNAVVAQGGFIYVFTGVYTSTTTAIHWDYAALLNTVRFIPAAMTGTPFDHVGNIVIDNPGLESNVWHLVYELPGKPAVTTKLLIQSGITCKEGETKVVCDSFLTQGARVRVIGTEQGGAVQVRELSR